MKPAHDRAVVRRAASVGLLVACMLLAFLSCPAITLDWSTVGWPSGTLTNSYDIDPSNPGNDVTVTITGYVADFTGKGLAVNTDVSGGTNSGSLNLTEQMQYPNQGMIFTVTVNFNYAGGVTNVQYNLFDVDRQLSALYPAQDVVTNIYGYAVYGGTNAYPTIITGPSSVQGGSGPGLYVIGVSNADNKIGHPEEGTVQFAYGATPINSFTWSFYNATPPPGTNSISQHLSMFDINYLSAGPKVPEVGVPFAPLAVAAAGLFLLLRRKFRASPASR